MKYPNLEFDWLLEITIDALQHKLNTYEITSKALVMMYLQRIAAFDQGGPRINAIVEINPEALHIAEALDYERQTTGGRGLLHGIPVLIKDNIDTGDKMHTSAGSLVLAESFAEKDAFLVRKLREAGAIIVGKTNLTEWANFISEDMPTGYSSRGGQVRNPYGAGFIVGGSSSGSGAAIAANFSVVSVGTETSGSILNPAGQNALVGIKPTIGLISRSGIIPISHSQDTAGPMARTVKDAVILLNALQGPDPNDPVTLSNKLNHVDYTASLNKNGLAGKRIGIIRDPFLNELKESKLLVMEKAIKEVKHLGAEVIDSVEIPSAKVEQDINVMLYEFKCGVNAYLKNIDPAIGVRNLADVIRKNKQIGEKALKYEQKMFLQAEKTSGNLTKPVYLNSLWKDKYFSGEKGIDAALKDHHLDAIVFPNDEGAMMAAKAGYPSITVPAGFTREGEPVGITFTAGAYAEQTLIEIAYAYEQGTQHRVPPALNGELE